MKRACKNCDFYDTEGTMETIIGNHHYISQYPQTVTVKGLCKLLSYTTPHKKPDDWCGSFKLSDGVSSYD